MIPGPNQEEGIAWAEDLHFKAMCCACQLIVSIVLQTTAAILTHFSKRKDFTTVHILPFLTLFAQLGVVPIFAEEVAASQKILWMSILQFFGALTVNMHLFWTKPYQFFVITLTLIPYFQFVVKFGMEEDATRPLMSDPNSLKGQIES